MTEPRDNMEAIKRDLISRHLAVADVQAEMSALTEKLQALKEKRYAIEQDIGQLQDELTALVIKTNKLVKGD